MTFALVLAGWIIVRSESFGMAWEYFCGMMQFGTLRSSYRFFVQPDLWPANLFIVVMLVVEWLQRSKEHGLELRLLKQYWIRYLITMIVVFSICCFGKFGENTFIYFQF